MATENVYCTAFEDFRRIAELLKEWTGREYDTKKLLTNTNFVVAIDPDTKQIVGTTTYVRIADPFWGRWFALVENVFVTESYRGKGIGKKLMEFTEWQARIFDCEFMKLTTRKDTGKKLYRSLGYDEGSSFYKKL